MHISIGLGIFTILFARCFSLSNSYALVDRSQMADLALLLLFLSSALCLPLTHSKSGCAQHTKSFIDKCVSKRAMNSDNRNIENMQIYLTDECVWGLIRSIAFNIDDCSDCIIKATYTITKD